MQLAPLAFDAATFEIWGPLLRGGRLALAPAHLITLNALEAFIAAHDVTVMWLTASLFNAVIDDRPQALARIRDLLIGGEALSVPHVRRGLSELPDTRIINGMGRPRPPRLPALMSSARMTSRARARFQSAGP